MTADENNPAPQPRAGRGPGRFLLTAIVVFVLATGAFGTLWFIERDNHKSTSDQIGAVDAELKDAEAALKAAEMRHEQNSKLLPEIRQQSDKARAEADANNDCANAGKAVWDAHDPTALRAAFQQLNQHCK